MKKQLRLLAGIVCLVMLVSTLAGCAKVAKNEAEQKKEEKKDTVVDDIKLSDSQTVYADDDDTSVINMYLTVSKGNSNDNTNHTWKDVNDHSTYYYEENNIAKYAVNGILQEGDENGPIADKYGFNDTVPNCTVTIRGKTSTRSPQKSYKIKLGKSKATWRGQRTINLSKHVYDATRLRDKVAYDLLRDMPGAFSTRTQFVRLYVKDLTESNTAEFVDYGLFTQTEQINKNYLRNHGLDENGQLYKASMFEFLQYDDIKLKTDPDYNPIAFEKILEIKGNDDHTKLISMLQDVNNYNIPIEDVIAKHFDEDNYLTWLAFHMIIGNTDTTSQNFFLYSPQNGNKFYFISWDNDGAFKYQDDIMFKGANGQYNYQSGIGNYWGSVLHQRMFKSETMRKKLDAKIDEIRKFVTKERVQSLVDKYEQVVLPYISRMPDQLYMPRTVDEHKQIVKTVADEMDYQYELYKESLKHPMPYFMGEPEIAGGQLRFGWNNSYDFKNEKITYSFDLARDPNFQSVIEHMDKVVVPQVTTKMLEPGQYFVRVTATNESGMTQSAMETYQDADGKKFYGVLCFFVTADGKVEIGN